MLENLNNEALTRISAAKKCAVLTGAGISAESGIPTFRDAQTGLWSTYDPLELATPRGFTKNPKLVWDWYEYRRNFIAKSKPNPGHYALAEMEKIFTEFLLITQNVDGLHDRAGNKNIIEIHGNINRYKCFVEETILESWPETDHVPPRCPNCGSYIRPDVVWFNESLPIAGLQQAERAIHSCDLFVSIGTSGVVYPVALMPGWAKRVGAFVIEVNIEPTPISEIAVLSFYGKSGEIMPALVKKIRDFRQL